MDEKAERRALRAIEPYPILRRRHREKLELSPGDLRNYEAVHAALVRTRNDYPDGKQRCNFLAWRFWDGVQKKAFQQLPTTTSASWEADFKDEVLNQLDLRNCNGCRFWKPLLSGTRKLRACFYCHDRGERRIEDSSGRCLSKEVSERTGG